MPVDIIVTMVGLVGMALVVAIGGWITGTTRAMAQFAMFMFKALGVILVIMFIIIMIIKHGWWHDPNTGR